MSKWLPIVSKKGMLFFYDKSTGNVQYTYPKEYDNKTRKYIGVFFKLWKKTPIPNQSSYCWKNAQTKVVQYVKPSSTTYIFEACLLDNFAFVELYIEYNGNINISDTNQRNCIHYAVMNDNDKMVKLLLKLGCDGEQKDNVGDTPLHYALLYRSYKCMRVLVEGGCNLNYKNEKGETIMHFAVKNRNVKLIYYLVSKGATISVKNKLGEFPIDYAVKENNWGMVKILTKLSKVIIAEKELEYEEEENAQTEKINSDDEINNESRIESDIDFYKNNKENKNNNIFNLLEDSEREDIKSKKKKKKKEKLLLRKDIKEDSIFDGGGKLKITKFLQNKNKFDKHEHKNSTKKNNTNYSHNNKISIDEINFLRESITERHPPNPKLKVKENFRYNSPKELDLQYKKIKHERIKEYKQNLTSRSSSSLSTSVNSSFLSISSISSSLSTIYSTLSSCAIPIFNISKNILSKFYQYSKQKSLKFLKISKKFFQNVKIFINTPPDIENQIEYINYMSSSFDHNMVNKLKTSYISEKDVKLIQSSEFKESKKITKKQKIKYNIYRGRVVNKFQCIFNKKKEKKYIFSFPKYILYKRDNETISYKKYINLLHKFKKDTQFIKCLKQQYNQTKNDYKKHSVHLPLFIDISKEDNEYNPQSSRSNGSAYENILKSINNINRIIDTATSTRSINICRTKQNQNGEIDESHWDNLDMLSYLKPTVTEDDNEVEIEDLLKEYNNKLTSLKNTNIIMTTQNTFSIINKGK